MYIQWDTYTWLAPTYTHTHTHTHTENTEEAELFVSIEIIEPV
jgi:hypothetical protein